MGTYELEVVTLMDRSRRFSSLCESRGQVRGLLASPALPLKGTLPHFEGQLQGSRLDGTALWFDSACRSIWTAAPEHMLSTSALHACDLYPQFLYPSKGLLLAHTACAIQCPDSLRGVPHGLHGGGS